MPASPLDPALPLTHFDATQVADRLRTHGYARLSAAALSQACGHPVDALRTLAPLWHQLPEDPHLKDGGRYRRRCHGSYVLDTRTCGPEALQAVPHRAHWQPTTYNALHGGMLRWFDPLPAEMSGSAAFRDLLSALGRTLAQAAHPTPHEPPFDGRWFIEAHPFRIDTTGGVGRPTPEGAHRDGVNFVAVVLVDRQGVRGGESRVFEADGPHGVRFTLLESWSALLLDDDAVIHESTPIQPVDHGGWRDTLVLTFRAGAFQDPPAAA